MVHYVRFLRVPQVSSVLKKGFELTAVIAVATDLGDSLLTQDVTLIVRIVDATGNQEILSTSEAQWKSGLRALKVNVPVSVRLNGRLIYMHITTCEAISAYANNKMPAIIDIWSAQFMIKASVRSEPVVERRLQGKKTVRMLEETGDSIARHIWDASVGCLMYLDSCFSNSGESSLPALQKLLVTSPSKRLAVLEVGAGCGLVGIALAQLRKCHVLLTDLEDAQDIMSNNINLAKPLPGSTIERQILGWGTGLDDLSDVKFDLVLVSDCIYNPDSSVLLVETLKSLVQCSPDLLIFVAFKRRHDADDIFFENMETSDLQIIERSTIKLPHILTDHDTHEPQIETYLYAGRSKST